VDALDGAPGIYSARFAGPGATDAENNSRLLHQLKDVPDARRSARFRCVLAFMRHAEDPTPLISIGTWEGRILHAPRGKQGFGYDPLFLLPELGLSSAELPREQKNSLSHRGQAVARLAEQIGPYLKN
jgi:XTP/dITP diphosphohydrolase